MKTNLLKNKKKKVQINETYELLSRKVHRAALSYWWVTCSKTHMDAWNYGLLMNLTYAVFFNRNVHTMTFNFEIRQGHKLTTGVNY